MPQEKGENTLGDRGLGCATQGAAPRREPPLGVRLGRPAEAALEDLCRRWRCTKGAAIRRALQEAVNQQATTQLVLEALTRIEARQVAGLAPPVAAPAEKGAPQDPSKFAAAWGGD